MPVRRGNFISQPRPFHKMRVRFQVRQAAKPAFMHLTARREPPSKTSHENNYSVGNELSLGNGRVALSNRVSARRMPFVRTEFCHAVFRTSCPPSQHSGNGGRGPREASSGSLRLLCWRSLGSSDLARESACLPAIANPLSRAVRCEPMLEVCKIFGSELAMPILAAPTAFIGSRIGMASSRPRAASARLRP